jgi:hypothetical protein
LKINTEQAVSVLPTFLLVYTRKTRLYSQTYTVTSPSQRLFRTPAVPAVLHTLPVVLIRGTKPQEIRGVFGHFLLYYLCTCYSYIPTPNFPVPSSFTRCSHTLSAVLIWRTNLKNPGHFWPLPYILSLCLLQLHSHPHLSTCPPAVSHTPASNANSGN